jgi:hypothetical protein
MALVPAGREAGGGLARIVRWGGDEMWPLIPVMPDVATELRLLAALSVAFVFAVFAVLWHRILRRRRALRAVTCPENGRPSLVVLRPDGDGVTDCSRWHDGKLDCGERCVGRAS